jgi:hypothetical protein
MQRDGASVTLANSVGDEQGQPGEKSKQGGQHRDEAASAGRNGQLMTGHTESFRT